MVESVNGTASLISGLSYGKQVAIEFADVAESQHSEQKLFNQASQANQVNQASQASQANQVNQAKQINQFNQVHLINRSNHNTQSTHNLVNQFQLANQAYSAHQSNLVDQVHLANQTHTAHQAYAQKAANFPKLSEHSKHPEPPEQQEHPEHLEFTKHTELPILPRLLKFMLHLVMLCVVMLAGLFNSQAVMASSVQHVEVDATVISPEMEGKLTAVKGPVPDMLLPMGPQFRIALFNLEYALNKRMRMDTVAKALRRLDAEIILLQNVEKGSVRTGRKSDATAELAQELSMNFAYAAAKKLQGGGTSGLAILSKYPILQSDVLPLPSLTDENGKVIEQRILMMSEIMIQGFDSPIIVMNTQLDPYGKTEAQIRQIMRLNELLLGIVPYTKFDDFITKIKILGGNFMSSAESPLMQELNPYWNHLSLEDRSAMRNYPLINPLADVDHFYTSRAQVWNVKKFEVLKGIDRGVHWDRCTDHAPLVAELQLIEQ